MKWLFFSLLLLAGSCRIFGQERHVPGDTIRGDSASYVFTNSYYKYISFRNVNLKDTTLTRYYEDGSLVPDDFEPGGTLKGWFETEQWMKNEFFTIDELEQLKGNGGCLNMLVFTDKKGYVTGIQFGIKSDDPVFTRIDANRLFKLEKKVREIVKLMINSGERRMKRYYFWMPIRY